MIATAGVVGKLKLVVGKGAVANGQPIVRSVVLLSASSFFQPAPEAKEREERRIRHTAVDACILRTFVQCTSACYGSSGVYVTALSACS